MPSKKKPKATASRSAKRRKNGVAPPKLARARRAPARQPQVAAEGAKQTIRGLKAQLADAERRIEALQASADTDFLLDILNRRGFERELHRAIAYIKR